MKVNGQCHIPAALPPGGAGSARTAQRRNGVEEIIATAGSRPVTSLTAIPAYGRKN
jgi:hypothetical protein